MEGCEVWVLSVQKGVKLENTKGSMQKYEGKIITIVYLYHGIR